MALQREPFGGAMFAAHVLGGFLFYAAPHLVWAGLCAAAKPAPRAWRAGFFGASAALVFIGAMSFAVHDPSGLPYQWLAYWPLAGILLLAVVVVWLLAGRPRAGA
jgi:hypothetical protein